jgi:hypothetical protein
MSSVVVGLTPPTVVNTADVASTVSADATTFGLDAANADSTVLSTLVLTGLIIERVRARDRTILGIEELVSTTADAEGSVPAIDVPQLLVSEALAADVLEIGTVVDLLLTGAGSARTSVVTGLLEVITGAAAATTSLVLLRRADQLVVDGAEGDDEALTSTEPKFFLAISVGTSSSALVPQHSTFASVVVGAEIGSGVWYKDPGRVAWLMNTETTAVSWYDNFDFESIAQPPGKVLAVGPDGLYELVGDTDSGEQIDAFTVSGFTDFGSQATKRVDAMYFGYTSDGILSTTVETPESGHPPSVYLLEQRDASAPRNSRVVVAKGLFGRYWRMTIRNVGGADFEIHDANVDIAVSTRRV